MAKKLPKRVSIPLYMFDGNIDVLKEHKLPCEHISFAPGDDANSVILMIGASPEQKEVWRELGFITGKGRAGFNE